MSRRYWFAATALLPLLLFVPSTAQTPNNADQNTPAALTSAYNQAMQAKDWPAAIAAAQQLAGASATSANLLLLGNAQLYGGAAEKSLVTKLAQSVRGVISVKNDMTVKELASN